MDDNFLLLFSIDDNVLLLAQCELWEYTISPVRVFDFVCIEHATHRTHQES